MNNLLKRKRNRLNNYNYGENGAYFITVCTKNREKIFWETEESTQIRLSEIGRITEEKILRIDEIYNNSVKVDKFVIMPNHIHLIIFINGRRPMVAPTVSRVIQQLKGAVSKDLDLNIWQKSFHDHVIRNEKDYREIWKYIDENPQKWQEDCYFDIIRE